MTKDIQPPSSQILSELEKHLLNDFQKGFPLVSRPYAELARRLNAEEEDVLQALQRLSEAGHISRVGPVLKPHSVGTSTLAAMAVPMESLEQVADLVSAFPQVNHNYEREHHYNLWFVVTASHQSELQVTLQEIERLSGLAVMSLPMLKDYHIDLGFELGFELGANQGLELGCDSTTEVVWGDK